MGSGSGWSLVSWVGGCPWATATPPGPRWWRAGLRATSRRPPCGSGARRGRAGGPGRLPRPCHGVFRPPRPGALAQCPLLPTSMPMKTPTPLIDILTRSPPRPPDPRPVVRRPVPHPRMRKTSTTQRRVVPLISASPHPAAAGDFHPPGPSTDRGKPSCPQQLARLRTRTTNKVTGSGGGGRVCLESVGSEVGAGRSAGSRWLRAWLGETRMGGGLLGGSGFLPSRRGSR